MSDRADRLTEARAVKGCGQHRYETLASGDWCRDCGATSTGPFAAELCWRHDLAAHGSGFGCDACLTLLLEWAAERAIRGAVERLTDRHLNLVMVADDSYQLVGDNIGLRPDKLLAALVSPPVSDTGKESGS